MTTTVPDRRAALKERTRRALLDGAAALVAERGGTDFTFDDLAVRCDVSRRTVFNHFASHDELVLAVCIDALAGVADDMLASLAATPVRTGDRGALLDALGAALHAADLPSSITTIAHTLGDRAICDDDARGVLQEALARGGAALLDEARRRLPGADPLGLELLVGSLLHGVGIAAKHWLAAGAEPAAWPGLLDVVLDGARRGYLLT